jgi:predicted metal-dependent peptidase
MTNKECIEKLEKARLQIFIQHPFLGFALQHFEVHLRDNLKTAATNGKEIFFDPLFLEKLTMKETIFILLHELLHILLMHVSRREDRIPLKYNIACDIVVNDILLSYKFDKGNLPIIKGIQYHIIGRNKTVEQVYDKLPKNTKVIGFDVHDFWELQPHEQEHIRRKISDMMKKANEKGYSNGHAELMSRIFGANGLAANKTNWKHILEHILIKDIFDYSYLRVDQRYQNVLLPEFMNADDTLQDVWFVIDVSGSMRDDEIGEMYKQIQNILRIFKSVSCYVSFFSTYITSPQKFRSKKELYQALSHVKSTGGTDFHVIFTEAKNRFQLRQLKALIIMTDGYAQYPEYNPLSHTKVIWAINNEQMNPPFGQVIRLV